MMMTNISRASRIFIRSTVIVVALSSLGACANMSRGQRNAGIGAAAGGALGYLVTGGPIGTVAGAAGGALIGAGVR